jgi:hypothetical protein
MVQTNIEEVFRRGMQPVEATIIANLVDTIQECRDALFQKYLEQRSQSRYQDIFAPLSSNALNNEATNESSPRFNPFLESNLDSSVAETRQPLHPSLDANFEGTSGSHNGNFTSNHHEIATGLDCNIAENSGALDPLSWNQQQCKCRPSPCTCMFMGTIFENTDSNGVWY